MADYRSQAQKQYDPSYNQKIAGLNNQLSQTLQGLDQSKGGINQNYDLQVEKQNMMNKLAKNNYNNNMLSRGIGKSSILTSGMAGMDNANARQVGYVNTSRTNALNDIEAQKALAKQSNANLINQMGADRLSAIEALAMQLEDRDFDKGYKNKQLDMQRAAQEMQRAYQSQQAGMAREQFEWQQKQYNDKMKQQGLQEKLGFMNALDSIKSNDNLSSSEKFKQINNLTNMMKGYNDDLYKYGYDFGGKYGQDLIGEGIPDSFSSGQNSQGTSSGGGWSWLTNLFSGNNNNNYTEAYKNRLAQKYVY